MKKHLTIFYGGTDNEREVSLESYKTVLDILEKNEDYIVESVEVMPDGTWQKDGETVEQDVALQWTQYAWIAMHGAYGEDGTLQRILESHRVPYNGSDSMWSKICFSKSATKDLFTQLNIKTPAWQTHMISETNLESLSDELFQNFPQPCVIKPDAGGSSFGVSIATSKAEVKDALTQAQKITDKIIVEEYIVGCEATAGVVESMRDTDLYELPPVEIVPSGQFFDYAAKYHGEVSEICPATFDGELKLELQTIAARVHKQLNLSDYSRTDFIIHPERGVYTLEVNTLPEFVARGRMEQMCQSTGISISEIIDVCIKKKQL